MKLIILAAGRGTRISRYHPNIPKSLLPISPNLPLLQYTIQSFQKRNIDDIHIVIGYQEQLIKNALKNWDIQYHYNPFFDVTNSIASLWFATNALYDDDIFIMNADIFLADPIFDEIINENRSPVFFADPHRNENADYKFYYKNQRLIKHGKDLPLELTTGEYLGMGKVSQSILPTFRHQLNALISQQNHHHWWTETLASLLPEQYIHVHEVHDFWGEIDYIEDYNRIYEHCNILFPHHKNPDHVGIFI